MIAFDTGSTEIIWLDRIEISAEPFSWEFAAVRRAEITEHFDNLKRKRSATWNGRVLLLKRFLIRDATLLGSCFETDYASFIAWHNWNCPDPTVCNFFAVAALGTADGAYLVGEMAPYTAGAGRMYFPCGTPDPSTIDDRGAFDPIDHLSRELSEETGINITELDAEPGWILVRDRCSVALIRQLTSRQNADDLRRRVIGHIRAEQQPELSDIHIIRAHYTRAGSTRCTNAKVRDGVSSGTVAPRDCQSVLKRFGVAWCIYESRTRRELGRRRDHSQSM